MNVLLRKDVDNIGYAGEVHRVSAGYARNYLLPRGLAEQATPSALKQAEQWIAKAEARKEQLQSEYSGLAEKVEPVVLTFEARASDTGRLFGSITTDQIVDALNAEIGTEFERRQIDTRPLRELGKHDIPIRIGPGHKPLFQVVVEPEGGVLVEEEEALDAAIEDTELAEPLTERLEPEGWDDADAAYEEVSDIETDDVVETIIEEVEE